MSDGGVSATVRRVFDAAPSAARLGAHLGHGVQRLVTDSVLGRVRGFPRRVGDLSADVLSSLTGLDDLETVAALQQSM
ncbi:hypothetical protein [Mycolicibacterium sp.]|uniref:hypothetical protein n=1 Tax=Mycolicibacterium sp. TaxID=2320850 RepID=UPI001A25EBAF|nr:hypothetical protein [Mycolicibacterium sp.]MBJ7336626.1 hypothetical protein [Mycolicibacterium sp.]